MTEQVHTGIIFAMRTYNFNEIEKKWQNFWDEHKTFKVNEDPSVPKDKRAYVLDMFPYPSSSGLHVGHPEGYTATDIYTRFLRMNGYHVLHPIGFDAFGLPAENYAIKTGTHPRDCTEENIQLFRDQIKSLGFSYDWDREISTHRPDYYHWTQWIFLKMFQQGLAYEDNVPINWCPSCKTGLANEEVNQGKCERCKSLVTRKNIRQWILKITEYADKLLEELEDLDWPESIKIMQRNWIGRSEGADVVFPLSNPVSGSDGNADSSQATAADVSKAVEGENSQGTENYIKVYTTRPDTLFGATYMVMSPEHPLVDKITTEEHRKSVKAYVEEAARKSELERTELSKEKTGVFTGAYAVNPVNGEEIPIWISDYILISYGTGAIMAVPAHDERDFEFAKKYNLPIRQVVSKTGTEEKMTEAYVQEGTAINSGKFDGLTTAEFKKRITEWLEKEGKGEKAVNYKLRDWIFSRQRYWGEPIPLVHCTTCGTVPLSEQDLPLTLPDVETYAPSGTGESPLENMTDWVNTTCPKCGGPGKRETNTMPQWAGSCWYYLRYLDPDNDNILADKEKIDYWMPVDLYVGGAEHAVLHLLYARFWHKVLYDLGYVTTKEPFQRLVNQGMILGEDGSKMSKSLGNVINPDDIVRDYGADSMRMYEMFMGPLNVDKPWKTNGLAGVNRFLSRIWNVSERQYTDAEPKEELLRLLHKTIKKVTHDTGGLEFNTAISQMMIFINELYKEKEIPKALWEPFIKMLSPFAPHMGEELWEKMGNTPSVSRTEWPSYQDELTFEEQVTVVVQINGKIRSKLQVETDTPKDQLEKQAFELDRIKELLDGKDIKKVIAVPNKLVNIVAK